jgi:hypothetical protein
MVPIHGAAASGKRRAAKMCIAARFFFCKPF